MGRTPKPPVKHHFGLRFQAFRVIRPVAPSVNPTKAGEISSSIEGLRMRVGSKGRYAVIALLDVAANSRARPVALAEVAERQEISLSYLEQLFAMLRRASLVVSSRGPGGGYKLQRPSEDITVGEVFRAVEESGNADHGRDWMGGGHISAGLWIALDAHIRDFLEGVTLADVINGKVNAGIPDRPPLQMDRGLSAD